MMWFDAYDVQEKFLRFTDPITEDRKSLGDEPLGSVESNKH